MWRKHCIFPPKTLWIATNHFVQSLSFDHQHNFFFSSWNTGSIIPLVSITYLALVHSYNTIKYICFINPRQRADMHLVAFYSMKNSFWKFFLKFKRDLMVRSKVIILLSYYFGMIQTDFFPTLNLSNWSINIFVKSST